MEKFTKSIVHKLQKKCGPVPTLLVQMLNQRELTNGLNFHLPINHFPLVYEYMGHSG